MSSGAINFKRLMARLTRTYGVIQHDRRRIIFHVRWKLRGSPETMRGYARFIEAGLRALNCPYIWSVSEGPIRRVKAWAEEYPDDTRRYKNASKITVTVRLNGGTAAAAWLHKTIGKTGHLNRDRELSDAARVMSLVRDIQYDAADALRELDLPLPEEIAVELKAEDVVETPAPETPEIEPAM